MGDEWIRGYRQDFVEDIQGDQVSGEGHAHGAENGQGKTEVISRLSMLLQCPHVSYGVDRYQDPEKGGRDGEHEAKGIHSKSEVNAREDRKEIRLDYLSGHHPGDHGENDQELEKTRQQGYAFSEIGSSAEKEDEDRPQCGASEGNDGFEIFRYIDHGLMSSPNIALT
jgi:hypothetical protein